MRAAVCIDKNIGSGCVRALTFGVSALVLALALEEGCAAQSRPHDGGAPADPEAGAELQRLTESPAKTAWLADGAGRPVRGANLLQGWATSLLAAGTARQFELAVGWPAAPGGKWVASVDLQISHLPDSERNDALSSTSAILDHLGVVPMQAALGALMLPIESSHPGRRPYSELTLASRSVLISGDLVTLQAGSDLQRALQVIGLAPWASEASAMVGWHTHMQLRWSWPSEFGEFSLRARLDRRADQLGRGLVEARWQGHL